MDSKAGRLAKVAYVAVFCGFGVATAVYFAATATSVAYFWLWTLGAVMFLCLAAFLASIAIQILRRTGSLTEDERVRDFRSQSFVVLIVSTLGVVMLVLALAASIVKGTSTETVLFLGGLVLVMGGFALVAFWSLRKPPVDAAGKRR
jgi:Kef-type K+ transport system membrane component KefB